MGHERAVDVRSGGRERQHGEPPDVSPEQRPGLFDTSRLVAFSDGVLSITITLLVFEVTRPEHEPGRLLVTLLGQWPTYAAFLASFLYVGVIWLNHKSVFARVRLCDRSLHLANLFVLMTAALIPFPTAVLSTALQNGNPADGRAAVALYALIAGFMCLSWLVLFQYLRGRPHLLQADVGPAFFQAERLRAALGIAAYAVAGVVGWTIEPLVALVVFLALPIFYGITSQGLTERQRSR